MAKSYQKLRNKMPACAQDTAHQKMLLMLTDMPLQELRQAKHLSQEMLEEILAAKQANVPLLEKTE